MFQLTRLHTGTAFSHRFASFFVNCSVKEGLIQKRLFTAAVSQDNPTGKVNWQHYIFAQLITKVSRC
jgi:hypothetical protein